MAETKVSFSIQYKTEATERYFSQFYGSELEAVLEAMRDAAGKAMQPVLQQSYLSRGVGRKTGNLYRSIKPVKIKRQPGTIGVIAGPIPGKRGGNHRHLIEFGTRAHRIYPKENGILRAAFGYAKLVEHPGARAKPFVTPAAGTALEAGQQAADAVLGRYLEKANALSSVEES
jgi:hypothetical protein